MMNRTKRWQQRSLIERVKWLRWMLPPLLAVWVVAYQLVFAQALEANYGDIVHYGVEIAFYSLAGPIATWFSLSWVEQNLREKEQLEQRMRATLEERASILEEERVRISHDLHDGVAQTLYFLALKTDGLRSQLAASDDTSNELKEIGQTVRSIIGELRRTIYALKPLDWSEGTFLQSLRQFVEGFAEQVGWQIDMAVDTSMVIPQTLEATVFRVVQESLNNVAKHARAKKVWIDLTTVDHGRFLSLTIGDDGQGFEGPSAPGNGLGMEQMRARVQTLNGQFHIRSGLAKGTTVNVRLPLSEVPHEHNSHLAG